VLQTVNKLLMIKGEENFATIDMIVIDSANRMAEFTKVGAMPTYILCNGMVDRISSAELPIGILDAICPRSEQRELTGLEQIIMMSDGISDVAGENMTDWLVDFMDLQGQDLADAIMGRAKENEASDDATVIVIGVERLMQEKECHRTDASGA
jgi:serine phosphatase RsbU (regulator of sigma subunit)